MTLRYQLIFIVFAAIISLSACEKLVPKGPDKEEVLDGPVDGLTPSQKAQFLRGDAAFNEVFTAQSGLGPVFVTNSCISCHSGDGKGHPSTTLIRFGQTDSTGNHYMHLGGPQLQHRALPTFTPEQIPAGATFSKFTPPAVTGLGFLYHVPDADIIAMSDPNDINGDGISGRVAWIQLPVYITPSTDAVSLNGKYIGKFGKKSGAYNLLHQTVNAYNEDMGIASFYNPYDVCTGNEVDAEVKTQTIQDLVFYLQTLKAPERRKESESGSEVDHGKNIFFQIQCELCHKSTLHTGFSPVEPLSFKEIHPYSDLLLHDMGPGLDDGYTEGGAFSNEWRTPPLWGLRLTPNSQGGQYFLLHDGRAHSIDEAIRMHGGEAENSKNQYVNLPEPDRNALIDFLNTL